MALENQWWHGPRIKIELSEADGGGTVVDGGGEVDGACGGTAAVGADAARRAAVAATIGRAAAADGAGSQARRLLGHRLRDGGAEGGVACGAAIPSGGCGAQHCRK